MFVILAMAAATIATRMGGLLLLRYVEFIGRTKKALTAVPPAVLMAVVTPTAISTGLAESVACAVTALAATRLSLLPAAATGVVTVAVLRETGL
nr:AzlD domain-containing protein [Rhizobium skierniewicense]